MANPTTGWDPVPIFGFWFQGDDVTPIGGTVKLSFTQRVTRVDGPVIYPAGATVTRRIGDHENDAVARDAVRDAWRAADEAAAVTSGEPFDGAAWDDRWAVLLTGAVFAAFPAADDPNIVQIGYQVMVEETLNSGGGKRYPIQPLLAHLELTPPGVNLGVVEVPPGSPSVPAPVYAKGIPGGVASLDGAGKVPVGQLPAGLGGEDGGAAHVLASTDVHGIGDTAALVVTTDGRLSNARTPTDGSVTDAKVAAGAGISLDKTADSATRMALMAGERSKLAGVDDGATANDTDDNLRNRTTHTGVQPSSSIVDFVEAVQDAVAALLGAGSNITLTYDDDAGVLTLDAAGGGTGLDAEAVRDAIGVAMVGVGRIAVTVNDAADTITVSTTATANSTDAVLLERANHTGAQDISTVTGLQTALDAKVGGDGSITNIVAVTQAAYDALTPDATTFYVIVEA